MQDFWSNFSQNNDILIFKHYEETKTKCKLLVQGFVEEAMLIQI